MVTDRTIRISFPDDLGVRTLNLIYDTNGISQPKRLQNQQSGAIKDLTEERPELFHVQPVVSKETQEILRNIKEGTFDLIATSKESSSGLNQNTLQLIRIRKTGEYFTYNHRTGQINKLSVKLNRTKSSDRFSILPGQVNWNYNFEDTSNFYKKYLLQDEIDSSFAPHLSRRYPTSFPERSTALPTLERSTSSLSERTKTTLYYRYKAGKLPLEVSVI